MAESVRVTNLGAEPIVGAYDGNGFLIPPGETAILPSAAAKKDWGDWEARNLSRDPKFCYRDQEYARLRGIYGVSEGARVPLTQNGVPVTDKETGAVIEVLADTIVEERLPKVKLEQLDGTPIIGVLDDPKGESMPLEGASTEDTAAVIEALRQDMLKQQQTIDALLSNQAAVDVPVDSPENAPRPKTSKPKTVSASSARE